MRRFLPRVLVLVALLSCLAAPALAEGPPKIDIVFRGIFVEKEAKWIDSPSALANTRRVGEFVPGKEGVRIPAQIGLRFGVLMQVSGEPEARYPIVKRTIFPKTLVDPKTGKSGSQQETALTFKAGKRYEGFGFDYDYELAPGTWTLQFLYEGKVIAEQRFEVYKP